MLKKLAHANPSYGDNDGADIKRHRSAGWSDENSSSLVNVVGTLDALGGNRSATTVAAPYAPRSFFAQVIGGTGACPKLSDRPQSILTDPSMLSSRAAVHRPPAHLKSKSLSEMLLRGDTSAGYYEEDDVMSHILNVPETRLGFPAVG